MNKVLLITGANSGFGLALTEAAVAAKDAVVAAARRPEALDQMVTKHPDQVDAVHLIVEPGSFRTGLFAATTTKTEITDYADTVAATRRTVSDGNGEQPGDPAKAAAAIMLALAATPVPLRLPLGPDALDAVLGHLDAVRADIAPRSEVARSNGFDNNEAVEDVAR